jgi:tetratricopeptide (TPR) repeat protein
MAAMKTSPARVYGLLGSAVVLLCLAACRQDPAAEARAFVASGDSYVAQARPRAAAVEYRNALEHQPDVAETHYKLAKVYEQLGEFDKAFASFRRVTQLDNGNIDAHLRVSSTLVRIRRFDEAERLVERVLSRDPRNVRALTILANALDGLGRRAVADKRLDEALAIDPRSGPAHVARGWFALRDGRWEPARQAFIKAIDYDRSSADAWTGLGTVQWATGENQKSEDALKTALELTTDKAAAHRLLASFYTSIGRAAEAEPHMKALAEERPREKLSLADYYLSLGKRESAEAILASLLADKTLKGEAHLRRAVLLQAAGRPNEAATELDVAIRDASVEARARLIKSEWLIAARDFDGAREHAERASTLDPKLAEARYLLGVAALGQGDIREAERSFKSARSLARQPAAPIVQLARIALHKGDSDGAVILARQAADAAPSPTAHALWARGMRAQGDLRRAREIVADAQRRWPGSAELDTELGYLELAARRPREARKAFDRALAAAPSAPATRLGVVAAQVATGDSAAARSSIDTWLAAAPDDAPMAVLSARLDIAEGRVDEAERTLQQTVRSAPNDPDAPDVLGHLYLASGRRPEAVKAFELAAARQPWPVATLTTIGMLKQEGGDPEGAQSAYEKALALDPNAGIAANNLAWLLAADGNVEAALSWARRAEGALGGTPEVMDTLGWVYHLSGKDNESIRLLEAARDTDPKNPTYHYHLGSAYLKAGRTPEARDALRRALQISTAFSAADDARKKLATIGE